jgi:hypothetical protein
MFCPSCRAEYRSGFDTCSDCDVALVPELPQQLSSDAAGMQTGAVLVWSGNDAGRRAQASATLERARLNPHTVSHQDQLFGTTERPQFEVYVAPEFAEKAKELLNGSTLSTEEWDQLQQSGAFELPDEEAPEDERAPREASRWDPDEATAEIWCGEDAGVADMIVASLGENEIECRSEAVPAGTESENEKSGPAVQKILVLPEDEARGREIVHEIVDATPL